MPEPNLTERVALLEQNVRDLEALPARMAGVELQIVQLREEMRVEFSAVRQEIAGVRQQMGEMNDETLRQMHEMNDETLRHMHEKNDETLRHMHEMNDETLRHMRVLHEEVLSRIAAISERPRPTKRKPRT